MEGVEKLEMRSGDYGGRCRCNWQWRRKRRDETLQFNDAHVPKYRSRASDHLAPDWLLTIALTRPPTSPPFDHSSSPFCLFRQTQFFIE
jgi:hypothetical protein